MLLCISMMNDGIGDLFDFLLVFDLLFFVFDYLDLFDISLLDFVVVFDVLMFIVFIDLVLVVVEELVFVV